MVDQPNIPHLQFTTKDYVSLRAELISRIPGLTDRWTDFNESDTGIVIVELLTAMMEIMLFNLDMNLNEAHFPTAVQRRSINNLVKLIDYQPTSITSARVQVLFDASTHFFGSTSITIPPYTEIGTGASGGIVFVTTTEANAIDPTVVPVVLNNLKNSVVMNCIEGSKNDDNFTSDGLANQKYQLTAQNIDTSTILVYVNGTLWTPVTSFVSADLSSQVYTIFVDENGLAYIIFGDGIFGLVPETNAVIEVDYIVSSGVAGTVGADTITTLINTLFDSANQLVNDLSVSNAQSSSPGFAQESIERIKQNAPALLAALFTAKSKSDYRALILEADPAITKSNAWGEQEEAPPNYNFLNKVRLTFTGYDSSNKPFDPNSLDAGRVAEYQQAKANVVAYLNSGSRKIITTRNVFYDVVYVPVQISGTIFVDLTKYDQTAVLNAVKQALVNAFGFDAVNFGQDIYESQVQTVINNVVGVSWSVINIVTPDPTKLIPTGGIGVIMKMSEIPIIQDDVDTGLISVYGNSHLNLVVADAIDLPVPDFVLP